MNQLNSLYKSALLFEPALLFEGKLVNNKIIYSKFRYFCISLINLILYIVIISHLIIFVSDLDQFKDHLVYFKFSDDYGSRILNLACGTIIVSFIFPIRFYKAYSRNVIDYLPFGFLFCFNEEDMHKKYHLTESRSKKQIKYQLIFIRITNIQKYYFLITFSLFIGKNCYDSLMKTSFDQQFLNYLIDSIKIFLSIWFFIAFQMSILASMLLTGEGLLDQIDKISKLFLNDKIKNKKQLNENLRIIIENYNLIIKNQKKFSKHFNLVLNEPMSILLFMIILPAILLNGKNNSKFITYFYLIDLLIAYSYISVYCYCNYIYLDTNNRFWKQFSSLVKYCDLRSSIKILNIYTLNNQLDVFSFNYRGIYKYTWNFLIHWFLESSAFLLLLYQANQFKLYN